MNAGAPGHLGRTAVLACDGRYGNVIDVVVCERRVQADYDTVVEPEQKQSGGDERARQQRPRPVALRRCAEGDDRSIGNEIQLEELKLELRPLRDFVHFVPLLG